MNNIAATIAKNLLQIKAIKLSPQNPFTWASGMRSPIYCDNRITLSYPEVRQSIIDGMVARSKEFGDFDMVSGVATAGIPHGAYLAHALGKPFSYVRSKAKAHGRQNKIEGLIRGDEKILLVEDLISTGGSSIEAVEALRAEGCQVQGVLAIFTYGFEKARQNFETANCPFKTLTDYDTLLEEAMKSNYIEPQQFELLKEWKRNPNDWASIHAV